MRVLSVALIAVSALLAGCVSRPLTMPAELAKQQVADTERAFAKSMADRDAKAFESFLSEDTVFFSGPTPLRGKKAVMEFWSKFFVKPVAPFSWKPEEVEVLDSGNLGLSAGPVYDPQGKLVARYSSIWRLEAPGQWRIIFDKGGEVCDCKP
ncbi:YybH family protein [Caenimonas koreensis]|uniref:YybH family protein n=1 Tax=Caenimonas koreensis TaxID=367474 RepID=UPI0037834FDF